MNGFDTQSDADAHADRLASVIPSHSHVIRLRDATRISAVDEDKIYAVFISCKVSTGEAKILPEYQQQDQDMYIILLNLFSFIKNFELHNIL